MESLRRIVLDVLKPHDPTLLEFTERVAAVETVDGVTSSLIEHDREVQNVELTVEGEQLDYGGIEEAVNELGGTVHSIDQAAYGEYVVEKRRRPQDG
jgi:hypothetical protein